MACPREQAVSCRNAVCWTDRPRNGNSPLSSFREKQKFRHWNCSRWTCSHRQAADQGKRPVRRCLFYPMQAWYRTDIPVFRCSRAGQASAWISLCSRLRPVCRPRWFFRWKAIDVHRKAGGHRHDGSVGTQMPFSTERRILWSVSFRLNPAG